MQDQTKEQLSKMSNNLVQTATEINSIMHDTVNATLQSVSVMVKGCGDLCDSLSSLMQKSIEQSATISQSLMSASSVDELVNTQNSVIKNGFDSIMLEMNNISQLSSRIAQQAAEPVTRQVNETISRISKTRAA